MISRDRPNDTTDGLRKATQELASSKRELVDLRVALLSLRWCIRMFQFPDP